MSKSPFQKRLEDAVDAATLELEKLKRLGLLVEYEKRPFLEDGIYRLVAYAQNPNEVNTALVNLSVQISLRFGLPLYILVSKGK